MFLPAYCKMARLARVYYSTKAKLALFSLIAIIIDQKLHEDMLTLK